MFAVKVDKKCAESVHAILSGRGLLSRTLRIRAEGEDVIIPLRAGRAPPGKLTERRISPYGAKVIRAAASGFVRREPEGAHFPKIEAILRKNRSFDRKALKALPKKWEQFGDVVVLKLLDGMNKPEKHSKSDKPCKTGKTGTPGNVSKYDSIIGEAYAKTLNAKTVVVDEGGIVGTYREPKVRVIYGNDTETTHLENGIKFRFDTKKIMFSSGNNHERERMAYIATGKNEVIADMFAGIGYFSVPAAFYSKPKTIYAAELNPTAYKYLCENIKLNKVDSIIKPLEGDCSIVLPDNSADRIFMGYLHETLNFLPKAARVLRNGKGVIHYHDCCAKENTAKYAKTICKTIEKEIGKKTRVAKLNRIKSFAPGIWHYVFDVEVGF